ncbi:peptidoglycan-binding protein [uncultured Thiodictyon sp.]|uniref:peptidoglycan-binding domain-containing protein n=1 Tax=uncultured Thiodictyon sp. TaxID=1846217 RepID=UPI0025E7A9A3|nr:peptidoglycan-binding protein [uncultured Thiodictyon sp.]
MATADTVLGPVKVVPYPGRIVKIGDPDSALVKKIEGRLNAVGCGPIAEDGDFDEAETESAVKRFQARFTDLDGHPLKIDGKIGSLTWGALFGKDSISNNSSKSTALGQEVVAFAATQIGVLEHPLGSNKGPEVDQYLASVGLQPGNFWCTAFTYFCYQKAADKLGVKNPHTKTGLVLAHWSAAKQNPSAKRVLTLAAKNNPALISPGCLFIIDTGGGHGHTGIVIGLANGKLVTIEGNTNPGGSSNGIGVFQRNARSIASINTGFIVY